MVKSTSMPILIPNQNFCPQEFFRMLLRQELGIVFLELSLMRAKIVN